MFKDSSEEMERKKKQIEEVFSLIEYSSGLSPQKVQDWKIVVSVWIFNA